MGSPFKMKYQTKGGVSGLAKSLGGSPFKVTTDPKKKKQESSETTWSEKEYKDATTTTGEWEKTDDGKLKRVIKTEREYIQPGQKKTKTYEEAGVDPAEAKKYWAENPEKYKEYLRQKSLQRSGTDVEERTEYKTMAEGKTPKEPERKAEYYAYRSQGQGTQSRGGSGTLEGAKQAAQKFGDKEATDIDIVYDSKAYGPGGMTRLIQTKEAANLNKIREGAKTNPNWRKDLAAEKQRWADIKNKTTSWRKSGSHAENMPEELKPFQERINRASERVQQKTKDKEKAYKSTRFN